MMKLTILASLVLISSVDARAQTRSGVSETAAYVKPVGDFLKTMGPGRFDSVSLTNLTRLGPNGQISFVNEPSRLEPLVAAMLSFDPNLKSFAALSDDEKRAAVLNAANLAESHAASFAEFAIANESTLSDNAKTMRTTDVDALSNPISSARELSDYLSRKHNKELIAAAARVKAFVRRRRELEEEFNRDLPGKIASGEINGLNLIGGDHEQGWHNEDVFDIPRHREYTLSGLFDQRVARLAAGPLGPWTLREIAVLEQTLSSPHIIKALQSENGQDLDSYLQDINQRLSDIRVESKKAIKNKLKNLELSQAFLSLRLNPAQRPAILAAQGLDIRKVEKFYYESDRRADAFSRPWIIAAIKTGEGVVPGWEELRRLKRLARYRYIQSSVNGFRGMFLAAITGSTAFLLQAPLNVVLALFIAAGVSALWMAVKNWRADQLRSSAESYALAHSLDDR